MKHEPVIEDCPAVCPCGLTCLGKTTDGRGHNGLHWCWDDHTF